MGGCFRAGVLRYHSGGRGTQLPLWGWKTPSLKLRVRGGTQGRLGWRVGRLPARVVQTQGAAGFLHFSDPFPETECPARDRLPDGVSA